jgi:hypothetical protein
MAKKAVQGIRPEDPIMGGHTAPLTPCPLALIAGWAWVMWCDPPRVCSMSGTAGHRFGWRRTAGSDAGKFFAPNAGPEELPDERPRRPKVEKAEAPRQVSRGQRRKAA